MSTVRVVFLAGLWTLVLQVRSARSDVKFLERQEGDSARLPCEVWPPNRTAIALRLKRTLLRPETVLFMYTGKKPNVFGDDRRDRVSVAGDPGGGALEAVISELRPGDTDRYSCEFIIYNPSGEDEVVLGKSEFFLLVGSDTFGSTDVGWVEVCAGGSAALACPRPLEEGLVEGVILKRQKGRAPAEVLYNSKRRDGGDSRFHAGRLQLYLSMDASDISYNLTLLQLQPEDSGLYSCQLHLHGRPESGAGMGRRVVFVSVQGPKCSCRSYSVLLYALSSAVAVAVLLLGALVVYQVRAHRSIRALAPSPIYEEMTGVKPPGQKHGPGLLDGKSYEYKDRGENRASAENHYESPRGAPKPRAAP